jgi:sec-independent protein translocase protein TatB
MFGVDSSELLIIAIVALVVIGPKDLPRVMRMVGQWVGRARGMAKHFRSGIDSMIRESELDEMQKKWAADNERIMREHPMTPGDAEGAPPETGAWTPPPAPPPPSLVKGASEPASGAPPSRRAPPAPPRRTAPPPPRRSAPPAPPRELP